VVALVVALVVARILVFLHLGQARGAAPTPHNENC